MEKNLLLETIENKLLERELKNFQPNGIESFELFSNRKREELKKSMESYNQKLSSGIDLLFENPLLGEKEKQTIRNSISFDQATDEEIVSSLEEECSVLALRLGEQFFDKGYHFGVNSLNEHQFEKAIDIFLALTALRPTIFQYWLFFGIALAQTGEHEMALYAYNLASQDAGDDLFSVLLWMTDSLIALNRLEEAKEAVDIVINGINEVGGFEEIKKIAEEKKLQLKNKGTP